jgi:cytoskeletal protein CcmA (bactofilin family)
MKRTSLILLLLVSGMICWGVMANAATFIQRDSVVIPSWQTIPGNLYVAAKDIQVYGRVRGDVFACGNSVKIRGAVKGDILAMGKEVNIIAAEADDIRACGRSVFIRGKIFNDILVFGRHVNIGGNIFGCVYTVARNLVISPYALIRGDLEYSARSAYIPASARIRHIVQKQIQCETEVCRTDTVQALSVLSLCWLIFHFLILFIAAGLIIKLAPNQVKMITRNILTQPWRDLVVGLLVLVLMPVTLVVLALTVIGLPFAVILAFIYMLILYFNKIFIAIALGEWLMTKINSWSKKKGDKKKPVSQRPFLNFILGIVLFHLLSLLPFFGGLIRFGLLLTGIGAIFVTRQATYQLARKKGVL